MKPNECFTNSAIVLDTLNEDIDGTQVLFVLGMVKEDGKMFGHAWNKIGDEYYDFTLLSTVGRNYYSIAEFSNINEVTSLPMFNSEGECQNALEVDGEAYDQDGKCSVYPYYKQLVS